MYNKGIEITKPWGKEIILSLTNDYAFKILYINANQSISLQYHNEKEETWYVSKGSGHALVAGDEMIIKEGDSVHLPPKTIHKITAITDMEIVEASSTQLGDIVRLDTDRRY